MKNYSPQGSSEVLTWWLGRKWTVNALLPITLLAMFRRSSVFASGWATTELAILLDVLVFFFFFVYLIFSFLFKKLWIWAIETHVSTYTTALCEGEGTSWGCGFSLGCWSQALRLGQASFLSESPRWFLPQSSLLAHLFQYIGCHCSVFILGAENTVYSV